MEEIVVQKDVTLHNSDAFDNNNWLTRERESIVPVSYKISAHNIFFFTVKKQESSTKEEISMGMVKWVI